MEMRQYADTSWVHQCLEMMWPVGSIYTSTTNTNPATLFGFGQWASLRGVFLLAEDDEHPAGSTGGEFEHALTVDEMPSHGHAIKNRDGTGPNGLCSTTATSGTDGKSWCFQDQPYDASANASGDFAAVNVGGGVAHNNMPPYLAVYMYQRIA